MLGDMDVPRISETVWVNTLQLLSNRLIAAEAIRRMATDRLAQAREAMTPANRHFDSYVHLVANGNVKIDNATYMEYYDRLNAAHVELKAAMDSVAEADALVEENRRARDVCQEKFDRWRLHREDDKGDA